MPLPFLNIHYELSIPIVIDTRETLPLFVKKSKFFEINVIKKKLDFGDYSLLGFENRIIIERKSEDIYTSLGVDRERFEKELRGIYKLKPIFFGLVIECQSEKDLYFFKPSSLDNNAIYGSLAAIEAKYGAHVYYGTRDLLELWIVSRFYNLIKNIRKGELPCL